MPMPGTRRSGSFAAARRPVDNGPGEVAMSRLADRLVAMAPPTTERDQVVRAINRLQPQRGTNIGDGLDVDAVAQFAR